MALGLEDFRNQAENHAKFFDSRGIPVYASLLRATLSMLEKGEGRLPSVLAESWAVREFSSAYERPLLLGAALRFEALNNPAHPLAKKIGDDADGQATVDTAELEAAIDVGGTRASLTHRFVQTNEASRSFAWQLAASCFEGDAPIIVIDLGSSAGATLVGDRVDQTWSAPDGSPITLPPEHRAKLRFGLDRRPVDLTDTEQATWLRACIWPGQHERVRRFRRAVDEVKNAKANGELRFSKMDAGEMAAFVERTTAENPDARIVVVQTAFIDYLPQPLRSRLETDLERWVSTHPDRAIWVSLDDAHEPAQRDPSTGLPFAAEMRLLRRSTWHLVAACEWHPRVIAIDHAELMKARAP